MLKYRSEDVEKGVVTFFDSRPEKRFGFMLDASGNKVFFHYNNGGNHGSRTRSRMPKKDDEIHFIRIEGDDRGPKARLWAFDRFDMFYDMRIKGWLKQQPHIEAPKTEPIELISSGRYLYHLQDIAAAKASGATDPISLLMLNKMEAEVAAFEEANPDEAKRLQERAKELAS